MEAPWSILVPSWILAAIAAAAALVSVWHLITHRWVRPKIAVRLANGSDSAPCGENEEIPLDIEFEYTGRGPKGVLRKDTLQEVAIAISIPSTYKVKGACRQNELTSQIFKAPPKGEYANMQYIFVPDSFGRKPPVMTSLYYREVERCQLTITPRQISPNGDKIKFTITCRQGAVKANSILIKQKLS